MRYKMSLFMVILMIVMTILSVVRLSADSDISFDNQNIENLTPKQLSPLSHLLSKRTIPLLREAFIVSQTVSDVISVLPYRQAYISPELSTIPGNITRYRKEALRLSEGKTIVDLIVFGTSLAPGTYKVLVHLDSEGEPWGTTIFDNIGKIIGAWPWDIEVEKSYIASRGEIKVAGASGKVIRVYEQKSSKQGKPVLTIPEATLKPGIYSAFNGPDAAVILDEKGKLIAALIGNGDDCDLYIATKAEVTGTLIQSQKESELPRGGKASFSEATLKTGTYRAVSGLDGAFIFNDKEEVLAILSKKNGIFGLHLACTVEVTETSPDSPLKPGAYKAFNGSDYGVILDEEYNILATSVFVPTAVNSASKLITTWGSIKRQ